MTSRSCTQRIWLPGVLAATLLFGCAAPSASGPDGGLPDSGVPDDDPDDDDPDGGLLFPCEVPWHGDRQFGTSAADEALALAIGPDDAIYLGGYLNGTNGQASIEPSGAAAGFVQRISPAGDVSWTQSLTSGTTTVEALAVRDAQTVIVGRTTGQLGPGAPSGGYDAFVAAGGVTGAAPAVLWQGASERDEHPRSIALGPDGQLFAAGWFDVWIPSNYVERWEDELAFSLKLDPPQLLWTTASSLAVPDVGSAIAADPVSAGGYAISGVVESGLQRGPYVRLVDPDGAIAWSRTLTAIAVDSAAGVAFAPDGDLIVAGSTFSSIFGKPLGGQDVYVAKLSRRSGETIWSRQFGSAASDWVKALAVDHKGTMAIAGETDGDVTGRTPPRGLYDVFALLISADGDLLGTWQAGSEEDDELHAVALDRCSRVFVAGATRGALFGPNLGGRDAWIARAGF